MRPQVVLLVSLAVFVVLVALPLGKANEEKEAAAEGVDARRWRWPCCDECGVCTRSQPPICQCLDTSTSGCNPGCKACVKSISDGLYECKDRIVNFCKRRCTRPPAAAAAADA
ncbi:Bowman-Birk type trypsin inhibitor [Sorghum bicolor]|uniref:Bowman-Birk serine protease inhibitors family domain-containing protein n=1 Tax=Sorghum bicolor TaxID=4558 RepID=C5XPS7_SORBI|nr:Bowman-Birk type trypsin inhibitor [Sorghum bicolor]EES03879.1 hypothetical protein SORBI_3003G355800 [Sorghum bicolor]|eukprot:XP_002458759.1 Bowman-Birk type trypsin inhibitor [Sorghum bicolor]